MSSERTSRQRRPVLVGQQLRPAAAAALERGDDRAGAVVEHALVAALAALGGVVEDHHAAVLDRDVLLAHRRQPVTTRSPRRTPPSRSGRSRARAAAPRRRARSRGRAPRSRRGRASTRRRSRGSAFANSTMSSNFSRVAAGAPGVVVAVLLAPGRVRPRRLDVPVRVRADPDVLPRRRDRELGDPGQHLGLVDPLGRRRRRRRSRGRGACGGSRGRSSRRVAGAGASLRSSHRRGLYASRAVANLLLETSVAERAAVIALRGELDLAGAAALEQELARLEESRRGAWCSTCAASSSWTPAGCA